MADKPPENIWKKLTRLFRSGPVVRHKIAAGEKMMEPRGTASAFKRELSSLYVRALSSYANYERLSRYSDYNEMEQCLAPDTLIAVPGGFKRIDELAAEYGTEIPFVVYAYDHSAGKIVPAMGKQARKTRTDHAWMVRFDNGKSIVATADHRLMLRDGTYRTVKELEPGMPMMPFKRRSILAERKDDPEEYQFIYLGSDANGRWAAEHRMVAEWMLGRKLSDEEEVHHLNFRKGDNRPENLRTMLRADHRAFHARLNNERKWDRETNSEWIEEFSRRHSEFMRRNNPATQHDVTFEKILSFADQLGYSCDRICEALGTGHQVVCRRLQEKGFRDWTAFATAYCPGWKNPSHDNRGSSNPRYDHDLTFEKICAAHAPGISPRELCAKLGKPRTRVVPRVQAAGFKNLSDFCDSYQNCKVVSVEYQGVVDLYDLTVDGYKNFATDSVISHNTPELHSAMDIYSDETTVRSEEGHVLEIHSKNQEIKEILEELFLDILDIDFNAWNWVRHLVKYGDLILFVDAKEGNGILNLFPIPINEVEREEGYDPNDPLAVRFRWLTRGNAILQNWQVIHFRLLGNDSYLPYGCSVLEAARRIWRQLILIEDAMLVYRIVRSPERRVFHIEIGNTPPEQVDSFIEVVRTNLKRSTIIDQSTGQVDLRYNPLSVEDDYFLPKRGETMSQIDTLAGGQFTGDIDDVRYIQSKLFAAIKIPRAYLGYDEDVGSKSTLSQEDVRFAKTIERIQRLFVAELNKVAIIHLAIMGFSGEDLANFELSMASPSTIAQQQRLELWRMRFEVAGMAQEGVLDRGTIRRRIFNMNDREIAKIKDGLRIDKLEDQLLQSIVAPPAGEGPPTGGGGEPAPGGEQLPPTLGGEGGEAPGGAPPAGQGEPQTQTAGFVAGPPSALVTDARNPGSEGDRAEIAVDKGRDLFATHDSALERTFGTKKQTASDPYDGRAQRRLITRPFSESEDDPLDGMMDVTEKLDEELSWLGAWLRSRHR